ncbi:MAG: NUDIX domain-containing protein [Myxococcota bacterium]
MGSEYIKQKLEALRQRYLRQLPSRVLELEGLARSDSSGDRECLKRQAHKLRGTAGSHGLSTFGELMADLETLLERGEASQSQIEAILEQANREIPPEAPRPSGTVVVLRRDGRALLLRRAAGLEFLGGTWVFPGGSVESEDIRQSEIMTARLAAVREAREEAALRLSPNELLPVSHWTTPRGQPRRFATWIFLSVTDAQEVQVDGNEIEEHRWMTPTQAIESHDKDAIRLPPPTYVTLVQLSRWRLSGMNSDALREYVARRRPQVFVPKPVTVSNGIISLYEPDCAYEDQQLDREGVQHRLEMFREGWRYVSPEPETAAGPAGTKAHP